MVMESSSTAEIQVREVKAVLITMPLQRQLAFSAWCCERLFPIYAVLSKIRGTHEGQLLRVVIDRLWDHVFGKQLSLEEIDSLCLQCDELEFDSDAEISPDEIKRSLGEAGLTEFGEQSVVQLQRSSMDAVGAVWSSLKACNGDTAENVTKAAQCLLESVHGLLWDELSPTSDTILPDTVKAIHDKIIQHPRMLTAWQQMQNQLKYLQEIQQLSRSDPKLIN